MALSIANKALVGVASTAALSGATYGIYSKFATTSDIKETLIKKSKTPLNLTAVSGEGFEHWQELVKQHRGNRLAGKTKITGLNLTSDSDIQGLKDKCKLLLNTKVGHADYEKNLTDAGNWCTKEGAPRKIASLLNKRNKVLLEDDNSADWNTPWTAFKKEYGTKDPAGNWEITGWTGLKGRSDVPSEFKAKCISNGKVSIMPDSENAFLEEIINYCTKEKPKG